jgi:hypothetical protein
VKFAIRVMGFPILLRQLMPRALSSGNAPHKLLQAQLMRVLLSESQASILT